MIPKIIHYTWFSGDPFPAPVRECIDSWHKFMPDWEYILWDAERIKEIDSIWVSECLQECKWAFAADYVRLYAVEKYGGIYLDTDCKIIKTLDSSILQEDAFIGQEWYVHIDCFSNRRYLTSHCFGAIAHHPFIARCLRYYFDRHFVLTQDCTLPDDLHYDQTLLPKIQCQLAMQMYGYNPSPTSRKQELLDTQFGRLSVYPSSYFNPYDVKSHAYVLHLALGGWSEESRRKQTNPTLLRRLKISFNYRLERLMWHLGYIIVKKVR